MTSPSVTILLDIGGEPYLICPKTPITKDDLFKMVPGLKKEDVAKVFIYRGMYKFEIRHNMHFTRSYIENNKRINKNKLYDIKVKFQMK